MRLLLAILALAHFTARAVPENNYGRVYEALANRAYRHSSFSGERGLRVDFTRFGSVRGARGAVVISPGRNESSLKYIELGLDLNDAGYSPVYVIDHRGQGLSGRELGDYDKGHVSDFTNYAKDFQHFMAIVGRDPLVKGQKIFAIGHSMGGAILTDYLMEYRPTSIKAVALTSPLFRIPLAKSEQDTLQDTFYACYVLGQCEDYIPGGGPFNWASRAFDGNNVTHSFVRFSLQDHLLREFPNVRLGDPTVRWVRETIQANIRRRDQLRLRQISSPVMIFQAGEESVVDPRGAAEICNRFRPGQCRLFRVTKARHEVLMELDESRSAVLARILAFFRAQ